MTTRTYSNDNIEVHWDASRCVHVAACIRALPQVFNPLDRPWVHLDRADADQIAAAIEHCPTGALRYTRPDGTTESPSTPTSIVLVDDGPLVVRGDLHLTDANGDTIIRESRLALCRCGGSENRPYCDGTHRRIGFRSTTIPVDSITRDHATTPADIEPPQTASFEADTAH